MLQEIKDKILAWLPLMKTLEEMGYDPIKMMSEPVTIEATEAVYRALTICKEKYPEWYSVMLEGGLSACFEK